MKNLLIIMASFFFFVSCSQTSREKADPDDKDKMVLKDDDKVDRQTKARTNWDEVDVTSPVVKYDEVRSSDIEVRGDKDYSVYSLDETILFDTDKATIKNQGQSKLKEVIESVKKRHPDGEIAVKGYTDSRGSADYNEDLAEQRAEAVAQYIQDNSDIDDDQISVIAKGEKDPAASNETAEGRQENRRVEIMARN
jgi:outer membrane protein OmpA-like peptidoglycan-associated protein